MHNSIEADPRRVTAVRRSSFPEYLKKHYFLYLMLAPALILTLIFKYGPMYGAVIAFKDFSPIKGILGSEWVGLYNFEKFLSSPNFEVIFMNTLKLSFFGLILSFPVPILLALMLNQVRRAGVKKNIQLFLYAPNFISVVVVVGMLFIFLSPTGPVNQLFSWINGEPVMFMSRPEYFRWIYILSDIWTGAGWASIIYVAALANVDPELHNAANLDGANLLQRIRHIDLPTIRPIMAIVFILAAGGIMSIGFEKAYLMQTATNLPTSEIIPTYVYKIGLQSGDYAYSAAVGLFNSVINVILLITVNFTVKKLNEGEGLY
ncbi:putative aldouronate transport system permease protein [Paenibacillus sp. PastF-1]|nr:putative aldouronate transport system permease protein [Paenibacillus sp. PastF-2]MDF9849302.1 putative aldouronate transport system permease protein [Paenibacillus sp. PastM-2]MDF9855990.1 putative aldouronate transport system permease protein [Paenibacillus sp. PastF-1]MDH6481143.1 putative aldouronate transport system permease protein [Paenibacillus sp. PastH-2]MDH6508564.1 putative aldouronate transport system permease protein [Paenibacillus sp. PastM-3]